MINAVFEKPMENVRKQRDIKLVTTDKRRNQLVSEPNYQAIKCFSENLVVIEMKKTKIKINKAIYLGTGILDISKILIYEFWCGYLKPKYGNKIRLCYMDTDSLIPFIKTKDFMKILQMMLKNDLICQIMRLIDPYLQERIKKKLG